MSSSIQRIFLIRHATSTANLDPTLYLTTPDHVIPLARPDDDPRALEAARSLRAFGLPVSDVCCWSSTYLRCRQTEALVTGHLFGDGSEQLRRRISFLLREQEFGDWDGLSDEQIAERYPLHWEKKKRLTDNLGRFYFRFPNGESRADVVQRVSIFLGKVHRSHYTHHVIFLHGVTQRAFRMAWFDRGPEWFEAEPNPTTASVLMISRDHRGWWQESYLYALRGLAPGRGGRGRGPGRPPLATRRSKKICARQQPAPGPADWSGVGATPRTTGYRHLQARRPPRENRGR